MKEISKIQTAIDENDNTDPTIIRLKEYMKTKQLSAYKTLSEKTNKSFTLCKTNWNSEKDF